MKRITYLLTILTFLIFGKCLFAEPPSLPWEEADGSLNASHAPFFVHVIPKCGVNQCWRFLQLFMPNERITLANISDNWPTKKSNTKRNGMGLTTAKFNAQDLKQVTEANFKMIAIVRDPRDALMSHVHYMRLFAQKPTPYRDYFIVGADFDAITLDEQIKSSIIGDEHGPSYIKYYKERLGWALSGYPLVVKFENLVGAKGNGNDAVQIQTIREMARHIDFDLSQNHLTNIIDNLYDNKFQYADMPAPLDGTDLMEGKIYKRASTGQWRGFLNEENKKLLKEAIGLEIIQLGYEQDLNW